MYTSVGKCLVACEDAEERQRVGLVYVVMPYTLQFVFSVTVVVDGINIHLNRREVLDS